MMPAEPCASLKYAGPHGARQGPLASNHPKEKQKHQRRPNCSVQHLRPAGMAYETSQGEEQTGDDCSSSRASQITAQQERRNSGDDMNHDEVPLECRSCNVSRAVQ